MEELLALHLGVAVGQVNRKVALAIFNRQWVALVVDARRIVGDGRAQPRPMHRRQSHDGDATGGDDVAQPRARVDARKLPLVAADLE